MERTLEQLLEHAHQQLADTNGIEYTNDRGRHFTTNNRSGLEAINESSRRIDKLLETLYEAVGHMKHMQQFIPAGYKVCIGPEYVTYVERCIKEATEALAAARSA